MARREALRIWRTWRACGSVSSPSTAPYSSSPMLGCAPYSHSSLPFQVPETKSVFRGQSSLLGHTTVPPFQSPLQACRNKEILKSAADVRPSLCHFTTRKFSKLGGKRELGLEVSRGLNGMEHGMPMSSWSGRRHQHVSTAEESKPAEETAQEGITITENCVRRIQEIKKEDGPQGETKMLRLSVEGGGCSGFLYSFTLDDKQNNDDRVFERDGVKVVVDEISYGFVKGATVDFTEELIRASFAVTINPNAASACGCGSSFNAK